MPPKPSLDATLDLMHDLRKRCDWDAAQTHESLRPYLIEEAHELDDAIREANDTLMREELGDLLLQVLFHSVMAEERGAFDFADVADTLITKMRGRHPHLYGDGVKEPWERMKSKKRDSLADGLPKHLPALHRAHRLQDRAAGVNFDWPAWQGAADKVAEELDEVRHTLTINPPETAPSGAPILDSRHAEAEEELGDLLFSVVNLCRKVNVHASLALDKANTKFQRRFEAMEAIAKARGLTLTELSAADYDTLWETVKST